MFLSQDETSRHLHTVREHALSASEGVPFEAYASGLRLVAEKPDWKRILVSAVTPGSPGADLCMATDVIISN
jgi:hypothetical protein